MAPVGAGEAQVPEGTVLRLREEFPDFLICRLHDGQGNPCFVATSTRTGDNGQPELVMAVGAEEPRTALRPVEGGKA